MSESQPGPGPQKSQHELTSGQGQEGKELERRGQGTVAVLDREESAGGVVDIFTPQSEPSEPGPGKELLPVDQHSKEVVVPDNASKELIVPEEHSKEIVPTAQGDERITGVIAGVTENAERQSALVSAEKKYDADSVKKAGWIRRMLRGIARHDIAREGILFKNRSDAAKKIKETHRLYDMNEEQWEDLSASHIQRILDDRGIGEMMDEKAGERQVKLESQAGGKEIRGVIDGLVVEYVRDYKGKYDSPDGKASMQEEMRRRMAELAKDNPDVQALLGEGEAYMSNIVDIAEAVRQRVSHEQGIQDVLAKVDIITARLDPGARTELKMTKPQKAFEWIQKHTLGIGNGTNLALAAAVTYGALSYAAKTGGNIATRAVTFGLFAGASVGIGFMQEKFRLRAERAQVQREAELGYQGEGSSKRREMLVGSLNEMKNVTVLIDDLRGFRDEENNYEVTADNFGALLTRAAEASARRDLSSAERRAFLSFSGETEVQNAEERRQLFLETVHARKALRDYYESNNLSNDSKTYGKNFNEFYESMKVGIEAGMMKQAAEADKEFAQESTRKAFWKGVQIAGFGFVGGQIARGVMGFASEHIQNAYEATTGRNLNADTATLFAWSWHALRNTLPQPSTPNVSPPNFVDQSLSHGGNFKLDDKLSFVENGNGTMTIKGPNGLQLDGLQRDADGPLTKDSWDRVRDAGLEGSESTREIPDGTKSKNVSVKKFTKEFGTKVHRHWFDNDTPTKFENRPHVERSLILSRNSDGDIVYSMRVDGNSEAFHGGKNADFKNGKFKLALSMTRDTQSTPILINAERDGNVIRAVIDKDDPVAKLFNGKGDNVEFNGKYAELAQMKGRDGKGALNMWSLATDSGPGSVSKIPIEIPATKEVGDMTIFMKTPEVVPPETTTPELDLLFVYPPYRTGLRGSGKRGEERSSGGEKGPDGDGSSPKEKEKSVDGGGTSGASEAKSENKEDEPSILNLARALSDLKAASHEAEEEFTKSGESEAFREKAKKAAERQIAVNKVKQEVARREKQREEQKKQEEAKKKSTAEKESKDQASQPPVPPEQTTSSEQGDAKTEQQPTQPEQKKTEAGEKGAEQQASAEQQQQPKPQRTTPASNRTTRGSTVTGTSAVDETEQEKGGSGAEVRYGALETDPLYVSINKRLGGITKELSSIRNRVRDMKNSQGIDAIPQELLNRERELAKQKKTALQQLHDRRLALVAEAEQRAA